MGPRPKHHDEEGLVVVAVKKWEDDGQVEGRREAEGRKVRERERETDVERHQGLKHAFQEHVPNDPDCLPLGPSCKVSTTSRSTTGCHASF